MKLAKPALDVGLYTNRIDASLTFWREQAHLPYDELLKLGAGVQQHRHRIGDSILKVNHSREPVPQAPPSGLAMLELFVDQVDAKRSLTDPDGNALLLSPRHADEHCNLRLHMRASDLQAAEHFYGSVLGLPGTPASGFQVGASTIVFSEGDVADVERSAVGYRYLTLQVFDVVGVHRTILDRGGREGMAPVRLGDVAYISFVRDPDGNWIEISQRKSITGSLDRQEPEKGSP